MSETTSKITISDLEVFYCVGVTDEERAKPQRLLVSVDFLYDFTAAASSDKLFQTINYYEVAQKLLAYGNGRAWKLIERVAANTADMLFTAYKAEAVTVEVKKFVIPQAAYVSVKWTRRANE